jgi:hypothetical protein
MKRLFAMFCGISIMLVLVGCPPVPARYTLKVSGGTYVQQTNAGQAEISIGTNIVVKLRTSEGKLPSSAGKVTLLGPNTWNNAQSVFFFYPAGSAWVSAPQSKISLVVGTYVVRVVVDGELLESTFQILDLDSRLPLTMGVASYLNENDVQKVNVSWQPVTGAIGYYARVLDASVNQVVSSTFYTLGNSVEIPVDVLSPSRAYFVVVVATTLDTVADDPVLPSMFNSSDSLIALDITLGKQSHNVSFRNSSQREVYTAKLPY